MILGIVREEAPYPYACASPNMVGSTPRLGRTVGTRAQELPTCCSIFGPVIMLDRPSYRNG